MLTGVLVAGTYEILSTFKIAGFGAEADIGGGAILLLGLLLIFTGATAAVAARPRPHPDVDIAGPATTTTRHRLIPATWPARMLALGLGLIVASNVMMNFDLFGHPWISAVVYVLGMFVAVAGGGALWAYRHSSPPVE